jgi:hypothetical protein
MFRPELDRGRLAWALTVPCGSVDRVWVVCSARCLEVLGDLPALLASPRAREVVRMRLLRPIGSA